jgi:hypothetical protein
MPNFQAGEKSDHHGNFWKKQTAVFTRQEIAARDSQDHGPIAQHEHIWTPLKFNKTKNKNLLDSLVSKMIQLPYVFKN